MRYGVQLRAFGRRVRRHGQARARAGRLRSDHAGLGADRIAIASLFLFGRRLWPAVAIGAFVANATTDASVGVSAAIAVGNTLEAVVGELPPPRGVRPALDRVRDALALIVLAAMVAPVIAATNGVTVLSPHRHRGVVRLRVVSLVGRRRDGRPDRRAADLRLVDESAAFA